MKKTHTPLYSGIILGTASIYLIYYFSAHGLWNPASVVVIIIMLLLTAGQILLWWFYFRTPGKPKNKK